MMSDSEYDVVFWFGAKASENYVDPRLLKQSEKGLPFQYEPLLRPGNIRLLQLLPHGGKNEVRVECRVMQVHVASAPKYEAVSYCWGAPDQTKSILLDNLDSNVGLSAWSALRSLRLRDDTRTLWIDAICINQNDPVEKLDHICMMWRIYAGADTIVVWLNENDQVPILARGEKACTWTTKQLPSTDCRRRRTWEFEAAATPRKCHTAQATRSTEVRFDGPKSQNLKSTSDRFILDLSLDGRRSSSTGDFSTALRRTLQKIGCAVKRIRNTDTRSFVIVQNPSGSSSSRSWIWSTDTTYLVSYFTVAEKIAIFSLSPCLVVLINNYATARGLLRSVPRTMRPFLNFAASRHRHESASGEHNDLRGCSGDCERDGLQWLRSPSPQTLVIAAWALTLVLARLRHLQQGDQYQSGIILSCMVCAVLFGGTVGMSILSSAFYLVPWAACAASLLCELWASRTSRRRKTEVPVVSREDDLKSSLC